MRRGALVVALVVGLGLAAAPAAFSMFERAPAGGRMLDDFRPFMSAQVLEGFEEHLARADAAAHEADTTLPQLTARHLDLPAERLAEAHPHVADLARRWPRASDELGDLLATIVDNEERFHAVDALPHFALFPWFFVVPGLLAAGLAGWGLRPRTRTGPLAPAGLAVLGVGLIAAPAVFGMFGRAPAGEAMLDDFDTVMVPGTVASAQESFLLLANAEGELRLRLLPALREQGVVTEGALPAVSAYVEHWQRMAADMAPMVGAMGDNLDRYAGLAALPPFGWFPWFFVGGGAVLLGTAAVTGPLAGGRRPAREGAQPAGDRDEARGTRQEAAP